MFTAARRHVESDFQLYACISEKCAEPPQLFSRYEDWKQHMESEHTPTWMQKIHRPLNWRCGDHDEPPFTDEKEFEEHVKLKHSEHAESPELEIFKELCQVRQPRRPDTCPVCNCVPDKVAPISKSRGSDEIREELLLHVRDHIKEVGFMSIDYVRDYDAEDHDVGEQQSSRVSLGGKDDNRMALEDGKWHHGEWVPADEDLASYVDPETLLVPSAPEMLKEDYDWTEERNVCFQQSSPEQTLHQTFELAKGLLGAKHRDTINCQSDLAKWLEGEKRFEEAEEQFRQVVELRKEVLGPRPDTITSLVDLSRVLKLLKQEEEAASIDAEAHKLGKEGMKYILGLMENLKQTPQSAAMCLER
jgi:hypothetical protein